MIKMAFINWFLSTGVLLASTLVSGSQAQSNESMLQLCIDEFDPNIDYYEKMISEDVLTQNFVLPLPLDLQEVVTATGFAVNYGNYYKIVKDQHYNLTYVLHQCGAPSPNLASLNVPTGTRTFRVPVKGPSSDSTIPVAFLELLGTLRNLSLTASTASLVSSSCVQKYIVDGDIKVIPDAAGNTTEVMFEAAELKPGTSRNDVRFDATFDGGPLKRAEWIKYMATFFNAEDRANKIFTYVNISYQCMNGSMGNSKSKPVVAWLSYFGGTWIISGADYKMQFDLDAGGFNLNTDTLNKQFNMSIASEVTSFHEILKKVDMVVDESFAEDPFIYNLDNFTDNAKIVTEFDSYPFLANQGVFRYDKRVGFSGGLDWFEMAIPQPHVVLNDMINMLYPPDSIIPPSIYFFRNIAMGEKAVNVTEEVCSRPIHQPLDAIAILYTDVMNCVIAASSPSNGATTLLSSSSLAWLLATSIVVTLVMTRGLSQV